MRQTLAGAWAVLIKDIRSEFRTRYAISSILLFAVISIAAMGFALKSAAMSRDMAAGLAWIIVFFACVTGLSRPFVQEAEARTELLLRQAASAESVWLGKFLFNFFLTIALEAVIFPVYSALMGAAVYNWPLLAAAAVLGAFALAGSTTIVAAMVAKSRSRGPVFAIAALPLMLPPLVLLIRFSQSAFGAGSPDNSAALGLVSYTGIMLVLSWLLFGFVWEE